MAAATMRPASLIATCDQWGRAAHTDTAIDGEHGAVTLGWKVAALPGAGEATGCRARGLATDRLCRIYRATATNVERVAVGPTASGVDYRSLPAPVPLFSEPGFGDVTAIAVDVDDRLYVADAAARQVVVVDLWSRRVLRRIRTADAARPGRVVVGAAAHGSTVWAVTGGAEGPGELWRLTARHGPDPEPLPAGVGALPDGSVLTRVAVTPSGAVVLLAHDPGGNGWLVTGDLPPHEIGPAADLAVDHEGVVVVSGCPADGDRPADPIRRAAFTAERWNDVPPLDARGDNGSGVVVTTDGRVGYWTARGFRLAMDGRVRYDASGRVVSYRFDSGRAANRWGRLLVEACIPPGTDLRVGVVTTDDPGDHTLPMAWSAPDPMPCDLGDAADPPDLPPPELVPHETDVTARLHRRHDHHVPWLQVAADDPFECYEAPVQAAPGRYAWVILRLRGDTRSTPMVRSVRVEHDTHTMLRRLPGLFSSDPDEADFLHRYLAMADSLLDDWSRRSATRDLLVDPASTPVEALDWLASFLGMVLDHRWPLAARRTLVAEAAWLYRFRGTEAAIRRYLEIYLGVDPVIVESYRLRGAGPVIGADPHRSSRAVLGAGFRVGGQVGVEGTQHLDGSSLADGFATHAHRFSVLVPRTLTTEQDAVVRRVLDTERPAHTVFELCTVDAGMRAGRGLHVGLSSIVGPTGGFEPTVLGASLLGRRSVVGWPEPGGRAGSARAGETARVG